MKTNLFLTILVFIVISICGCKNNHNTTKIPENNSADEQISDYGNNDTIQDQKIQEIHHKRDGIESSSDAYRKEERVFTYEEHSIEYTKNFQALYDGREMIKLIVLSNDPDSDLQIETIYYFQNTHVFYIVENRYNGNNLYSIKQTYLSDEAMIRCVLQEKSPDDFKTDVKKIPKEDDNLFVNNYDEFSVLISHQITDNLHYYMMATEKL